MPNRDRIIEALKEVWSVEDQFEIAKALAANCGYQLVKEDNERSLKIKDEINYWKCSNNHRASLLIQGLEALLK